MSKSAACDHDIQEYQFSGIEPDWAQLPEFFISLHTEDPGKNGDQSTNEIAYTGYRRYSSPRPGGLTVNGVIASNPNRLDFPERTSAGPDIIINFIGIGVAASGATKLLHSYRLVNPAIIRQGDSPYIPPGLLAITED